jgi:hypothetical protein
MLHAAAECSGVRQIQLVVQLASKLAAQLDALPDEERATRRAAHELRAKSPEKLAVVTSGADPPKDQHENEKNKDMEYAHGLDGCKHAALSWLPFNWHSEVKRKIHTMRHSYFRAVSQFCEPTEQSRISSSRSRKRSYPK